ncbi:aldo/keto reductase [Streptomyces roseus]|uniref:aldo/keto reductase n=1 Tax=Streptomyces roseus TaxID=66430 RepID=UPI0036C0876E
MNQVNLPYVRLNSDTEMPSLGLGIYQIPDGGAPHLIRQAAALGYRLTDAAASYGSEPGVGIGVRESHVPREDFFVVSELHGADHGYDRTLRTLETSLKRMQLDYLDLYLVHWPLPKLDLYVETWRAMCVYVTKVE